MNEKNSVTAPIHDNASPIAQTSRSGQLLGEILKENKNRNVVIDYYVYRNVSNETNKFAFNVFIRLNAKEKKFKNISFIHCIFDNCYLNNCVFDSCDFTGCRFLSSNFHQATFRGCDFRFATFEHSQREILIGINHGSWQEELFGLSSGAIDRWVNVTRLESSSVLVELIRQAADKLFSFK